MNTQSEPIQPESRIGEVIDDRYRIVAHLGTGGMASVYRAEHLHNTTTVAVKVLHEELNDNAELSARFRREAQAARSIRHPNVVSVYDFGRLPDGCCYMILEYIPGEDLCLLLHREGPLMQVRAAKIGFQIANALVAAHAVGVVHRDLKPDNIMLIKRDGDPDFVKVVDFGIAKIPPQRGPALTAFGTVFGTPEYMAPEQARGATVDHRTDLYALGIVLYEMLVGRTPFAHEHVGEVLMGQITKPAPPLDASLDAELRTLVARLLAKEPMDRVQSAAELANQLSTILNRLAPNLLTRMAARAAQAPARAAQAHANPASVKGPVQPAAPIPAARPAPAPRSPAVAAPAARAVAPMANPSASAARAAAPMANPSASAARAVVPAARAVVPAAREVAPMANPSALAAREVAPMANPGAPMPSVAAHVRVPVANPTIFAANPAVLMTALDGVVPNSDGPSPPAKEVPMVSAPVHQPPAMVLPAPTAPRLPAVPPQAPPPAPVVLRETPMANLQPAMQLAGVSMNPVGLQDQAGLTNHLGSGTKRSAALIGYAIALLLLMIAAVVLGRWLDIL